MLDPNYKFHAICEDADRVAMLAMEIAFHYREAMRDGITAYREERIKAASKLVEVGMRRLRTYVEVHT